MFFARRTQHAHARTNRPVPRALSPRRGYNSQRKWASWTGGSMFASLETFKQVRILKQEWEDDESIVHRKSF